MARELSPELISSIQACDLSEHSQAAFRHNLKLNGLNDDSRISFVLGDTKRHLLNNSFDIVDLDPYGSAVPFLFQAISALGAPGHSGLLCVTFTDSKVLAGSDRHKCYYDYGVVHGGSDCEEENSIRGALYAVSRVAATLGKAVRPLLCFQSEFYIRLFLEVESSKQKCWASIAQHGLSLSCPECNVSHVQRFGRPNAHNDLFAPSEWAPPEARCSRCGGGFRLNGPLWLDALYDLPFLAALRVETERLAGDAHSALKIASSAKVAALLNALEGEQELRDDPRTFSYVKLFRRKGVLTPSCKVIYSALHNHDHRFAPSFLNRSCFKTTASAAFLLEMVAQWELLARDPAHVSTVNFARHPAVEQLLRATPVRFLPNPEKNWGPKPASRIKAPRKAAEEAKRSKAE